MAVTVRPHAAFVVLGEGALEDRPVGCADRRAHPLRHLMVVHPAQGIQLPRTNRTAISLATSPAACPPMPSAR